MKCIRCTAIAVRQEVNRAYIETSQSGKETRE